MMRRIIILNTIFRVIVLPLPTRRGSVHTTNPQYSDNYSPPCHFGWLPWLALCLAAAACSCVCVCCVVFYCSKLHSAP